MKILIFILLFCPFSKKDKRIQLLVKKIYWYERQIKALQQLPKEESTDALIYDLLTGEKYTIEELKKLL